MSIVHRLPCVPVLNCANRRVCARRYDPMITLFKCCAARRCRRWRAGSSARSRRGTSCIRPAPGIWWKCSAPPSLRLRVEQLPQWISRERKSSVPSKETSVRPPRRRIGSSAPHASRFPVMGRNSSSKCAEGTPSSICRTWLSQGTRTSPDRVCALDRAAPARVRWCARNDSDWTKNTAAPLRRCRPWRSAGCGAAWVRHPREARPQAGRAACECSRALAPPPAIVAASTASRSAGIAA